MMEEAIKAKQETIAEAVRNYLAQAGADDYWGLADGRTGMLLYLLYAHKHGLIEGFDQFEAATHALSNVSLQDVDFSYGVGKAGVNWLFQFMLQHGLLDEEDTDLLCFDDTYLESFALGALEAGNYDFFYGAAGVAAYLLYRHGPAKEAFIGKVLDLLTGLATKHGGALPAFHLSENKPQPDMVNLGLAHGLPAIIKLCVLCYTRSVCREASHGLALQLIGYIRAQVKEDTSFCFFPSVAEAGKPGDRSRLGWCYGDLGIAFVLYQAGLAFVDPELQDFALQILIRTTGRKSNEQTLVYDAGLCHGSAGLAHMYRRLWQATAMPVFGEAADYWIGETLRIGDQPGGVAGYRRWDAASNAWVDDYSLLEGAAGIGLVLMSYLTGDCSWDYCLLLAD